MEEDKELLLKLQIVGQPSANGIANFIDNIGPDIYQPSALLNSAKIV